MNKKASISAERLLQEGAIDALVLQQKLKEQGLITTDEPKSRLAEELRIIKRPLLMNMRSKSNQSSNLIMVTSSVPSEGKTFMSLNLALSIAMERDTSVLLIDADVAKPDVDERLLGITSKVGFIDVIAGSGLGVEDVIIKTDIPDFSILPAGRPNPHATELLASRQMRELMDEVSQRYSDRVIVIDAPPLLATSEASVLVQYAGQLVMVVEAAQTPKKVVKDALQHIPEDTNLFFVMNKVSKTLSSRGRYGYGYGHYGYGRK